MNDAFKWNFTKGTPSRVILQVIGISMFMSAINLLTYGESIFHAVKGSILFIAGIILFILREHVSNGDYFNEFDNHLKKKYEILPPQNEEETKKKNKLEGYI